MTRSREAATRALSIEVIETSEQAAAIVPEWADLAGSVDARPFSLPSFALAWWRHLGRGRLRVVTARDGGGALVGVAPLHVRPMANLEVVRWLGHGLGVTGELLVARSKADVASTLWQAAAPSPRAVLQLVQYRHGGPGLDRLRAADDWTVRAVLSDTCPTIDLRGSTSADDLLAAPGRRGLRKKLARVDRALGERGSVLEIEVTDTGAGVDRILDEVQDVYDRAEAAHPRQHLMSGSYRPFLLEAMAGAADAGQLALLVARIDGVAVGFDLHLRAGRVACAWLGRYRPEAAEWSPGHLLLRAGIDWALKADLDDLDLQLGGDEYKRRWASGGYDTVAVTAARSTRQLRRSDRVLRAAEVVHRLRRSARF